MSETKQYPSFVWKPQWLTRVESLRTLAERTSLIMAITYYGLYGDDESGLYGEGLDYFNNVVKPDLDKQHAQFERKAKR